MSDYNRDVKILVTVIEGPKTDSFLIDSPAVPWYYHVGEIKSILEEFLCSDIDFGQLLDDYREIREVRRSEQI